MCEEREKKKREGGGIDGQDFFYFFRQTIWLSFRSNNNIQSVQFICTNGWQITTFAAKNFTFGLIFLLKCCRNLVEKKSIFILQKFYINQFSSDILIMKNIFIKKIYAKMFFLSALLSILFFSCKTVPKQKETSEIHLSRNILGTGQLTEFQLADFFLENNTSEDKTHIINFAKLYIEESLDEGINSDAAFAQMCLETGFLRFGGLVQPHFHNYCGLGAMDAEHPGEQFETEQLGVRAHIQHLHAYATPFEVSLKNELIDPRYNWVHKTKFVQDIFGLTGTWASDPNYGNKIDEILSRMEIFAEQNKKP